MIKEFRVGELFGKSLSILFANFFPFMTITLIVQLPAILIDLSADPSQQFRSSDLWSTLLSLIMTPIATGAVTFGVFQELRGRHASFGSCMSVGFSRMLPVLGVAICVGLVTTLGFIFLIVPGLILTCMLWVAIPVAVVERVGVGGSLGRSQELTAGHRWPILGLLLLRFLVQFAAGVMIGFIVVMMPNAEMMITVGAQVVGVFVGAWHASVAAVSYYYLRSIKEMIDVDEIASVFD